jgi:DNA-binding GntR family transcriptional regulator
MNVVNNRVNDCLNIFPRGFHRTTIWRMSTTSKPDDAEEAQIVERIYEAVMDQRLAPGAKLSEASLCEAFGVGRMRIRRSLLILASREVVDLQPNRGAYVAQPSAEQAREIFEARLAVEPSLVRIAAQRVSQADIAVLQQHLENESAAHHQGNRREAIRLSGQFHAAVAQAAGNSVMLRIVKDLVTRSSLIIGMYGDAGFTNCRDDEHTAIVSALAAGDADQAEGLMRAHLEHITQHLQLERAPTGAQDLLSLFGAGVGG